MINNNNNSDISNSNSNSNSDNKPPDSNAESKSDATPTTPASENLSSSDSKDVNDLLESNSEQTSESTTTSANKRSLAFTFNFDNVEADPATTAAKYKNVMERFQSRHRRGASMSKIDQQNSSCSDTIMLASSISDIIDNSKSGNLSAVSPQALHSPSKNTTSSQDTSSDTLKGEDSSSTTVVTVVRLRSKNRSTSRVRDAAKRHSWSPRSSNNELSTPPTLIPQLINTSQQQQNVSSTADMAKPVVRRRNITHNNIISSQNAKVKLQTSMKNETNTIASHTSFTPRSTAMQLALQKVELPCPEPALEGYNHKDEDIVSETGTYTLNGDNYTEEQKDLMNIDRNARNRRNKNLSSPQLPLTPSSPNDLKITENSRISKYPVRASNVFEVNYYHDESKDDQKSKFISSNEYRLQGYQSADAYLEKIKSRVFGQKSVKSTGNTNKDLQHLSSGSAEEEDIGCFTSVTTSGVLAKQSALDPRPKLNRKSSLTTSQIDSSEYISNEMKMKNASNASCSISSGGGFTDHEKAEYRLNLFTNQKDMQKFAKTRNLIETPPETPKGSAHKLPSDIVALKTAQTKNDWIQQWARNARARSLASDVPSNSNSNSGKAEIKKKVNTQDVMSRSCTCASPSAQNSGETDDNMFNKQQLQKALSSRYRLPDYDYTSDPSNVSSTYKANPSDSPTSTVRPPKSPSKIPSPLHSLGRARSASRTRSSLQGFLLDQEDREGDIFLQKTAAAINNLQESLSRNGSFKSPTSSCGSPRLSSRGRNSMRHTENEALQNSSIESYPYYNPSYPPRHRRNLSNDSVERTPTTVAQVAQLMTSSFDEQQLQLLTSGEYLIKQMRMRKNSFEGSLGYSPLRRLERNSSNVKSDPLADPKTLSPLHRAGSFVQKQSSMQARSARPNFQNIYTPPAARQNYVPMLAALEREREQQRQIKVQPIRKSASSNNFGQTYSDYDDNLEYYIQDEDDYGENDDMLDDAAYDDPEYEMSGNHDLLPLTSHENSSPNLPIANTRYNKALLMRIERSKQIVAEGGGGGGGIGVNLTSNDHNKPSSAPAKKINALNAVSGVMGCPNTPELPRRAIRSAPRPGLGGSRQSVPRDTSLNRLASRVPNSLASAKYQLLQTAAGVTSNPNKTTNQHVQPKYLDISKYKPVQGNTFLRKNESKSTLKTNAIVANPEGMKRSPSSSGFVRGHPGRASSRSVQAAMSMSCSGSLGGGNSGAGGSNTINSSSVASLNSSMRASSAARRDTSVSKQKQIEMAMWKRRSTYDPMKAAAEDRRRKEEAKRMAITKNLGDVPSTS